jgi:exosome complex RNA-binding protein Csl4
MATIQEINSTIIAGNFTNDQLNAIVQAVKFARNQIATKNKFTFVKGTKVKFVSSKSGQYIVGTVEDVKRKFVHVRENTSGRLVSGVWRVPANMLEAA